MSSGKWLPKEEPPDYQPTNLLEVIAQKFEELAAIKSREAQVSGELSGLFRSAKAQQKGDAPLSRNVA